MDTVTIQWTQTADTFQAIAASTSTLPNLDQRGFYVILGGNWDDTTRQWISLELLYIGQAFDQTLRTRIPQPHDAYRCVEAQLKKTGKNAIVMVGIITEVSVKLTQDFVDDVECCLIYSNQPLCNQKCKEAYTGRPIKITNTGATYIPVKPLSQCSAKASS